MTVNTADCPAGILPKTSREIAIARYAVYMTIKTLSPLMPENQALALVDRSYPSP